MTKTLGFMTTPNYKVQVVLGIVIVAGQVIRNESATSIVLGTKEGVTRYIKECGNIVSLKVTDLRDNADITPEFSEHARFVASRYGQPTPIYDIRKI